MPRTVPWLAVLVIVLAACGGEEPSPIPKDVLTPGPVAPPPALAPAEVPDWAEVSDGQKAAAKEAAVPVAFENSIGMRFVLIPAGTFPNRDRLRPRRSRKTDQDAA